MSRWVHVVVLRSSLKPVILSSLSRAFHKSAYLSSHYDTLKVNPTATLREIKDAYLKLTKEYHPDLHPGDPKCHERFIALQEAYKVLSNPDTRRDYDTKARNRPPPRYQRPYSYPDFTQRDEWLKKEELRRQAQFSRENFNQFYSRPHKMTPEELEKFYKYKKFVQGDRFLYYLFGAVLAGVVLESFLLSYSRDQNWQYPSHGYGHRPSYPGPPAVYGTQVEHEMNRFKSFMNDDTFKTMTRNREDSSNSYPNEWEERNTASGRREF